MSNPSFSNIDLWLFEYSEGNLSPEQIAQLEFFLLQHPELQIDKDMWDMSYVSNEEVVFPNQERLERKKPIAFYWMSVAAVFVLLLGGYTTYQLLSNGGNSESTSMPMATSSILNKVSMQQTNQSKAKQPSKEGSNSLFHFVSATNPLEFLTQTGGNKLSFFGFGNTYNPFENAVVSSIATSQLASSEISNSTVDFDPTFAHAVQGTQNASHSSSVLKLSKLRLSPHEIGSVKREFFQQKAKEAELKTWKLHRKSAKNSHKSFSLSAKLREIHRKIEKMIDNPISLKNLKDPYYHVPGMQSVDINFGATGTLLATRVQTTSRYQWMGESNDQLSNQLLIDGYAYAIRGGIGLQINQSNYHKNGYQNTYAAITYSPKISLNKNITVEPAIRFKMGNRRIDADAFELGQLVEVERQNVEQFYAIGETPKGKTLWYKDFGLSLMVNTKWFFAGMQVDNLAQHQTNVFGSNSTQRAPLHSVFTVGTDYQSKNKKIGFSPYLIYQNYGSLSEAWLGANFRANWFTVGAGVSSNLEPAASIGLRLKHFSINYNADLTHSNLLEKNVLSHQISLRFITNHSRIGKRLLTL